MNELHKLVEKWRARAADLYAADPVMAAEYERCANEPESALAGGGEAVAWVIADPNGVWRFTRYNVNLSAYKDEPGYTVTPLFTHPAGAVQVDEAMVELALKVFSGGLQNYYPSGYCTGNRESMRAALTAALNPGGSRE